MTAADPDLYATPPPFPEGGNSNRNIEYKCSNCHKECPREKLTVKRVMWATMGRRFKSLRSRTVGWYCGECRDADPAWTQERLLDAPGNADVKAPRA